MNAQQHRITVELVEPESLPKITVAFEEDASTGEATLAVTAEGFTEPEDVFKLLAEIALAGSERLSKTDRPPARRGFSPRPMRGSDRTMR